MHGNHVTGLGPPTVAFEAQSEKQHLFDAQAN